MPINHLFATTLAFTTLLAGACGDGASDGVDGGPGPDAVPNDPPNPNGLGPAPIELGSPTDVAEAGAYVLLAKSGITNATGSLIVGGHVGLSPATGAALTGFGEIMDASTEFWTSASVQAPGKIYTPGNGEPTPTNLTTAVLSMQAGYTDAASRTNPDALDLASGAIGGQTLAPGLYRWGTGVTIADELTLAGGASDVWILQISDDVDVSTGMRVELTGGALAKNVFWQVAGQVTIHADAHFAGIVLAQTAITLQTNATMTGRALAQTLIALDDNAVTAP